MKASKMFIQVTKKGLLTIECSDCHRCFGIDPDFVIKVSEVNFKYTCPYCSGKHILRND